MPTFQEERPPVPPPIQLPPFTSLKPRLIRAPRTEAMESVYSVHAREGFVYWVRDKKLKGGGCGQYNCVGTCYFTPPPGRGGEVYCIYCGECSLFVICLSVCLSVRSRKSNAFELRQVLCMLPMAVARSSSDGVAIRYVLPVLWMCFHIVEPMSENRVQHYFSKLR